MQKHRIAILCHASAGGSGVVATELALALSEMGHEIHVIASERPFRLTDDRLAIGKDSASLDVTTLSAQHFGSLGRLGQMLNQAKTGIQNWVRRSQKTEESLVSRLHFHAILDGAYPLFKEPMTALTAANSLVELIEQYKIEIVHAHYAIPFATSAIMARDMGYPIKVVTTLHGTDITLLGQDPAYAATTKHAVHFSDAVTAVSHSLAANVDLAFGHKKPVAVIHNWVDTNRFVPNNQPKTRAKFAHPDEAILVHVSNFRAVKRPQDVIRVFAQVNAVKPSRLLMIGDGPERASCLELARELDLLGRIQFIEFVPNVEDYICVADVFLLPSEQESFGLAALEAMSCGVPVVAYNVGGLSEVVEHGTTGFLCDFADLDGMATRTLEVLLHPDTLLTLRFEARSRAIKHFTPELILPQYVAIYDALMTEKTMNIPESTTRIHALN